MATAREAYFPIEADDRVGDRLLPNNSDRRPSIEYRPSSRNRPNSKSLSSDTVDFGHPEKPRKFISFWVFSLIVIGIAVMFLLGVCVGFYVRELQMDKPDFNKICGHEDKETVEAEKQDRIAAYHESLVYYIRANGIRDFVEEFGVQDPTTGDTRDQRLADAVLKDFRKYSINNVDDDKFNVVVTSPDPVRPNELEILHHNGSNRRHFVFESNPGAPNRSSEDFGNPEGDTENSPSENWKFPHVAFSPSGVAEGRLVYAHLGRETDFVVLRALGVDLRGSIVIMRMGRISVAEKIRNCELYGVKAALLYWQDGDVMFDLQEGFNSSGFVPYASAIDHAIDETSIWRPSIPCQTVSADQAAELLTLAYELPPSNLTNLVMAPQQWQSAQNPFAVGFRRGNSTYIEYPRIRLSVYHTPKKVRVRTVSSSIQSSEEPDSYVVIGAPRSSLPGQPEDAVVSTSILIQVARAFRHVHQLHSWLPRRGVRLVSWGGAELSNIGIVEMIRKQHHLMGRRMIAYFDLRNLMIGNDTIQANVPGSLLQLLRQTAFEVPNPRNGEQMLYQVWSNSTTKNLQLGQYRDDPVKFPFLHIVGIPTLHVQYAGAGGSNSPVSVTTRLEQLHHFKFHLAATRMLILTMLSVLDNRVLPFDLSEAAQGLHDKVWQTSHSLQECSGGAHKFGKAMSVCEQLETSTKSLSSVTQHFLELGDSASLLSINRVSMLLDRLFIRQQNGWWQHLLYPVLSDGSLAVVSELCQVGLITGDWNMTTRFHDTLTRVLTEAVTSLRMGA